jgi:ubiquinone/menaquinone biosynthesis C-methylase UbiE
MKLNWGERLAVNNPLRPWQQRLETRWMKKRALLKPGALVAEVGCGRGAGALIIKRKFQPEVLQAMDLDIRMIQKSRKYLSPREREGVSFYVGDVMRLPYRQGVLDAVFGFGILHHIPNWQEALAEIVRVLQPGGFFFFEEIYPSLYQNLVTKHLLLHPRTNRFRSQDLKKGLEASGLHLAHFFEIPRIGIIGIAAKGAIP